MFEKLQLPGEGRDKAYSHCCWCFPMDCATHFLGIVSILVVLYNFTVALPNLKAQNAFILRSYPSYPADLAMAINIFSYVLVFLFSIAYIVFVVKKNANWWARAFVV